MDLRKFIISTSLATAASLAGWLMVVFFISLSEYGWWALVLFYGSFLLFVFGLSTLLTFYWQYRVKKLNEVIYKIVKYSFKNGFWLALVLTLTLFLQSQRLLNWPVFICLLAMFAFVKIFIVNIHRNNK